MDESEIYGWRMNDIIECMELFFFLKVRISASLQISDSRGKK